MAIKYITLPLGFQNGHIKFSEIDVPQAVEMPFAIVRYEIDGVKQELGLSYDMDKRVFIDRLEGADLNEFIKAAAPQIADILSRKYSKKSSYL